METPYEKLAIYTNCSGHMTKMAAAPKYGKNRLKTSTPEPEGLPLGNLVCSIGDLGPTKFVQMMIIGCP